MSSQKQEIFPRTWRWDVYEVYFCTQIRRSFLNTDVSSYVYLKKNL